MSSCEDEVYDPLSDPAYLETLPFTNYQYDSDSGIVQWDYSRPQIVSIHAVHVDSSRYYLNMEKLMARKDELAFPLFSLDSILLDRRDQKSFRFLGKPQWTGSFEEAYKDVLATRADFTVMKMLSADMDTTLVRLGATQRMTYPGCPPGDRECAEREIKKYIVANFKSSVAHYVDEVGEHRIETEFAFNAHGWVKKPSVQSPHPMVTKEMERVLKSLPRVIPGHNRGIPAETQFNLDLTFNIGEMKLEEVKIQ